ncbi:MAG: nucleotidyltransferase domain-containing protein [Thermoleophilia bacterium]
MKNNPENSLAAREPAVGSPEWRMLVATARLELDDDAKSEIIQLVGLKIDWGMLIHQSTVHGTAGLMLRHLSALSPQVAVPGETIDELRGIYLKITASSLKQMAQFKKVARKTGEAGVEIIVLKGAALAESLYGDVGLRPLSDVDILIREADWQKVSEILKLYKYSAFGQDFSPLPPSLTKYDIQTHLQFLSPVGTCLEYQFDLFTLGIGMLDMPGVWMRSRESVVGGEKVRVLSAEDQLLHLVIHANRHGCSRLKWLVDIAESLRQSTGIDWDKFVEIARRERATAIVFLTLIHIEHLLKISMVPRHVMERMAPSRSQRMAWNYLWPQKEIDGFHGRYEDGVCYYFYKPLSGWNLLNFVLTGRIRDKLHYQARWIVPSLDWMAEYYGQRRSLKLLRYYPVRLVDRMRKERAEKPLR